jgi:hypothetical protein
MEDDKDIYFVIYNNYKALLVNKASQIVNSKGWSDEFSRSVIKDAYEKLIKEFKGVDFKLFTKEELLKFDFGNWDDDLILMPIWAID